MNFRFLLFGVILSISQNVYATDLTNQHLSQKINKIGESAFDTIGGGSLPGVMAFHLQGGFPWLILQAQIGLKHGWTPFLEIDTAGFFARTRPSLGVALRWLDTRFFRITGEALLGWEIQRGLGAFQAPSVAFRLRMLAQLNRFAFFIRFDTRHTMVVYESTISQFDDSITRRYSFAHRWSPWGSLGIGYRIAKNISLDLELVSPWIDAPSISIPGLQAGINVSL